MEREALEIEKRNLILFKKNANRETTGRNGIKELKPSASKIKSQDRRKSPKLKKNPRRLKKNPLKIQKSSPSPKTLLPRNFPIPRRWP